MESFSMWRFPEGGLHLRGGYGGYMALNKPQSPTAFNGSDFETEGFSWTDRS